MRLAYFAAGSFAITKHLDCPRERTSNIIWFSNRRSINTIKSLGFEDVSMTSMSPEDGRPRR